MSDFRTLLPESKGLIFEEIIEEHLLVNTDENISLAVLIRRPKTDQKLPVLMTYTPYRVSTGLGGVDLLDFAKYGYVTLIFDVRGTGDSSGICDSIYSDDERADGLFMINWAASQSWCNGNVGMWGISYGAIISIQMAAKVPSALKAIIARSGSDDPFAEWTNLGGVPRNYIYESYSPFMSARNFAPPSIKLWGDKWQEIWQQRLDGNTPWGISFLNEIEDSNFWRDRAAVSQLNEIACPVFVVEGWSDWYSNPMLRIFSKLQGSKRALIGPWGHQWPHKALPGPRINWHKEALLWWDHWLKGIDNGIEKSSPLTIYVEKYRQPSNFIEDSPGFFITAKKWPIEKTHEVTYFLNYSDLALSTNQPESDERIEIPYSPKAGQYSGKVGGGPFRYNVLKPLDQRLESHRSITFLSGVNKDKTLIVGNPKAHLYLSSDSDLGQISASLVDKAPNGSESLISRGFINISYAHYPKEKPAPLKANEIYEVDIQLHALAYQLEPGHRIALKLAAADVQMSWPAAHPFTLTLHNSKRLQSSLTVPYLAPDLLGSQTGSLPATIELLTSDKAPELPSVSYQLTEDIVNNEFGYRFESKAVFGNSGLLRINNTQPGFAEISARSIYEEVNGPHEFRIEADCTTTSDPTDIWHQVEIIVTVDGKEYFRRSYESRKPRRLF
ncbi:MAG: CocE/NonD family hydrolase [Actinomycetota bacterium]|nr:CocE/NonD family hydrolase [Actinomycetota bacterium]